MEWVSAYNLETTQISLKKKKKGLMCCFPAGKGKAVLYGYDPIRKFPLGFCIKPAVNSGS